jgi:hypothetical protein
MQFERLPEDSEFDCRIAFDTEEEQEVIRAVYTEHIAGLAKTGNIGSIQPFDIAMSHYSADDGGAPYKNFMSAKRLIEMVQTFHDNTETEATEIALGSPFPDFENLGVGTRLQLGKKALKLVEILQEETSIGDDVRALRDLPETEPDRNINL